MCVRIHIRARAYTYTRTHTLLSIYARLELFCKYYKETVIHVHDMYQCGSKEGLTT